MTDVKTNGQLRDDSGAGDAARKSAGESTARPERDSSSIGIGIEQLLHDGMCSVTVQAASDNIYHYHHHLRTRIKVPLFQVHWLIL